MNLQEIAAPTSHREVFPCGRMREINLRNGQPWLDHARIDKAIQDFERLADHRLMEINESPINLLLKGTVVDDLADWYHGRTQPVRLIDWEPPRPTTSWYQPVRSATDKLARPIPDVVCGDRLLNHQFENLDRGVVILLNDSLRRLSHQHF